MGTCAELQGLFLGWMPDGSSGRRLCGAGVEGKASAGQARGVPRPPRRSQHPHHHLCQLAPDEQSPSFPFIPQQVARPKARVGPSLPSLCPQSVHFPHLASPTAPWSPIPQGNTRRKAAHGRGCLAGAAEEGCNALPGRGELSMSEPSLAAQQLDSGCVE